MHDQALIWITDADLEVTSFTARLRDLAGLGEVYFRIHVSDLWAADEPYGVIVIAHRWALEGQTVTFEAPAYGSTYLFTLEPLQAPGGQITGVSGRAVDLQARNDDDGVRQSPARLVDRGAVTRRLTDAVARAGRRGAHCAVLFLDVDDFPALRERCGNNGGDRLLTCLADHLLRNVRAVDTVARLSGGTFVVLLEDLADARAATRAAHELLRSFDTPIPFGDGRELAIGVSIGVAIAPHCASAPSELLALADREMFLVKSNGGRGVKVAPPQKESVAALHEKAACSPRYLADPVPFATRASA
ncbi:MAG TPA: GGDEF domain-containing protein [Verrucomicrobiae bacterium]|nr:GGDEF domain-containing protein [Verrucomicrobiae bacterium]